MHPTRKDHGKTHTRLADRWQFRLLVGVTYPVFLALTLASRLMPGNLRFLPTDVEGHGSVFAEARAAALTTLPFAFMG